MDRALRKTVVLDRETPEELSARLRAPVCMILRANRLVSAAWLTPGREIAVPDGDFCKNDAFPCPVQAINAPAREKPGEVCIAQDGDEISALASAMGTTERLLLLARGRFEAIREGERILLDSDMCKKRIGSVLPGETLKKACERLGADDVEAVARLNRLGDAHVWPGMRLILPDRSRECLADAK